jgi:hypothetical protein
MVKLVWTVRPEIREADSNLAVVTYRLAGADPVVWKIVPKMADADDKWAARIASDATEAIRRYLLEIEGTQRQPLGH